MKDGRSDVRASPERGAFLTHPHREEETKSNYSPRGTALNSRVRGNHMVIKKGTMSNLESIKDRVESEKQLREGGTEARVTVHLGTCGLASGGQEVMDRVLYERSQCGRANIAVCSTGCIGLCSREPLVTVELMGKEPIIYQYVDDRKMAQIFRQHVLAGRVQVDFALARGRAVNEALKPTHSDLEGILPHISELKFFSLQEPRVLRNKGL